MKSKSNKKSSNKNSRSSNKNSNSKTKTLFEFFEKKTRPTSSSTGASSSKKVDATTGEEQERPRKRIKKESSPAPPVPPVPPVPLGNNDDSVSVPPEASDGDDDGHGDAYDEYDAEAMADDEDQVFCSDSSLKCDRRFRTVITPFCAEMTQVAVEEEILVDPTSFHGVKFPKLTRASCSVYCHVVNGVLKSCGHTMNTVQRNNYFRKLLNLKEDDPQTMFILCNLENLTDTVEEKFQSIYDRAMKAIIADDGIPLDLRIFYRLVYEEGGEELGAKKKIYASMLEFGTSERWKFPQVAEFGAYDESEMNRRKNSVIGAALTRRMTMQRHLHKYSLGELSSTSPDDWYIFALASWKTGYEEDDDLFGSDADTVEYVQQRRQNHVSAKVNIYNKVYGEKGVNFTDTIDRYHIQDAETLMTVRDIGFDTDFPDELLQEGLGVFLSTMETAQARHDDDGRFVFLPLDRNNHIFKASTSDWSSMVDYLECNNFIPIDDCYDGESVLYAKKGERFFVEVNKPFCIAADSRLVNGKSPFNMAVRIVRGMTIDVCCITAWCLEGLLDPDDLLEYDFPGIRGGYFFGMIHKNLHMNVKIAAAFQKCAFATTDNPLKKNNLVKTPSRYPISTRARSLRSGSHASLRIQSKTDRKSSDLIARAVVVVSHDHKNNGSKLLQAVQAVLGRDDPKSGTFYKRWFRLLGRLCGDLERKIRDAYDATKTNPGNSNARGHTVSEKERTALVRQEIFEGINIVPRDSKYNGWNVPSKYHFWVSERKLDNDDIGVVPDGAIPVDGTGYKHMFQGKPLWNIFFGTIRQGFQNDAKKTGRRTHSIMNVFLPNSNRSVIRHGSYVLAFLKEK